MQFTLSGGQRVLVAGRHSDRRRVHQRPPHCTPPRWNPQNTDAPQVVPSRDMSPHQALVAQLEAIRRNDDPWTNHGVQTMYEFAADAGSMERSRYFGFSKDLYHLDHFLVFHTKCASLVDCCAYAVLAGPPLSLQQRQPGGAVASPAQPETNMQTFHVHVTADSRGEDGGVYELVLVRGDTGLRAGCWMTKSCVRVL